MAANAARAADKYSQHDGTGVRNGLQATTEIRERPFVRQLSLDSPREKRENSGAPQPGWGQPPGSLQNGTGRRQRGSDSRAHSSVGSERSPDKAEVLGSNPSAPNVNFGFFKEPLIRPGCSPPCQIRNPRFEIRNAPRGRSSIGRAPRLQRGGCRFDPGRLHSCR